MKNKMHDGEKKSFAVTGVRNPILFTEVEKLIVTVS